jgi:MFS family permease
MNQVHRWRAFAVLAVSFFMTVADLAIVNVALPTIGRKLHMPESSLQWVVTGYGLTSAASCCSAAAPRICWGAAAS